MKTLIILGLVLSSLTAFAAQKSEFRHLAYCEENPNSIDSKVTSLNKSYEDQESVHFKMLMSYGSCSEIDQQEEEIKFQPRMIQLGNYGVNIPFVKTKAEVVGFELLNSTRLIVEIKFQKSVLIKKNSKRFILEFWAQDWVGFPWVAKIMNNNGEMELELEGYKPL